MKLKADQVYSATLVVAQIIRENRAMSDTGKFLLARMHRKLLPEFEPISERRDAMITAYDFHPMVSGPKTKEDPFGEKQVPSPQFAVPPDKAAEFSTAWKEIGDQEIEVAVEPVSVAFLGSIAATEFVVLGDLVKE